MFGKGIACLPAHLGTDAYQSYLMVMPADVLATLYERFGARLLEQNVRTFLQARGNVNQGIRATILNEPGMFFAYNNGIPPSGGSGRAGLSGLSQASARASVETGNGANSSRSSSRRATR